MIAATHLGSGADENAVGVEDEGITAVEHGDG